MAKKSREEKAAAKGEDYEFTLPAFDEKAFIRREIQLARASFWTVAVGVLGGVVATALMLAPVDWKVGWLPIIASMALLRPLLQRLGFGEEATSWKSIAGSSFLVFFTGLAVWILGVNIV